jgi:hypothetical protein
MPLPGSEGTVTSLIATLRGMLLAETDSGVVEFEAAFGGATCSPRATPVSFTAATPSVSVAPAGATESGSEVMGATSAEKR